MPEDFAALGGLPSRPRIYTRCENAQVSPLDNQEKTRETLVSVAEDAVVFAWARTETATLHTRHYSKQKLQDVAAG